MSDLQDIRELSVYSLANMADVHLGSNDGEGAALLTGVRDATLEAFEYARTDGDTYRQTIDAIRDGDAIHEIADGAPSVYTFTRWQQFVDLAAWQTDISDLTDGSTDMEAMAGYALYEIARTLADAILADLEEWADEMDAAADEDDEDAAPAED